MESDHEPYIIYANHINFLVANDYIELPKLSQHDISDRSKSNGLTKFLTAAQVSWLAVQVIVRVAQQLEVAYLEITTLSFVVCAIGTFASWYRKPYDVQTSMIIQMPNHFISDIRPLEKHWDSFRSSHPEACQDLQNGLVVNSKFTMLDVIFDGGGSFTNQFTDRLRIWRPNIAPRGTPYQPDRIRNDRFPLMDCYMFAVFTVVVFGYAAIHVAAWNSPLPTKAEQYLWRVSSLSLAGTVLAWVAFDLVTTPIIVVPFKIYLAASLNMLGMKGMTQVSGESNREIEARVLPPKWRIRLSTVLGLIYLPSRAFILIESFVALRSMPASVYQQVDWGKVVPHI
ncbi:hypothetical protein H2198_007725 [Neophaeococcomyces mojaviensis]|uniref:Uncharacterized protein n=1 Tax=Neophaeococcomyces mojaviensis TaxID=3383035 RepID=A0ACC2ZZ97_9EURO|nr:hypothetical protein H2198_007725 [Knufia sp. JES_112]